MGTIKKLIMNHAMEIAASIYQKNVELKQRCATLEFEVTQLAAQIDSYSSFNDRVLALPKLLSGALICPECWIRNSRQSVLDDQNKCRACELQLVDS